jgi:peroxiredoxin
MQGSRITRTVVGLAIAGVLAMAGGLRAAEYNTKIDIGDEAPTWSNLPDTDGKKHSLKDYEEQDVLVVVFTCNGCPVAQAYEQRLTALAKEYKDKSVAFVAINVNSNENLEAMKQRAEEKGFAFPYIYDASQKSAESYGASVTPHVFVLNKDRKIAYMGSVDDNMNEEDVEKAYLKDAIDQLLAGKQPVVKETRQFGCSIKWN